MSRAVACAAVLTAMLFVLAGDLSAQEHTRDFALGRSSEGSLARDLLRELVEIDTTPTNGSTRAAEAMAVRLRSAGFSDSDVLLLGPRPDRQNVMVRLRGNGQAKPILLIAHLDVVDAPREGWSAGLDPFRLTALGTGQPIPTSPLLPEVMDPIEKLSSEMWPGIPVLPVMDPWTGDSARLRRAGIPTYGTSGAFGEMDLGNAHGADERLPVESFDQGVEFLYRLLKRLTAGDPARAR